MDKQTGGRVQRQGSHDRADLARIDDTGQPIAAQQENVAGLDRMRPLDVHLDFRVRSERTDDDVLLEVAKLVRVHALPPGDFPDPGMIEGELLGDSVSNAVSPAIADMTHPRSFGPKDESGAGRPHAAKLRVLLADGMNAGVGLAERPAERGKYPLVGVFLVKMGNVLNGLGAGFLADGVATHSIGHHENVPARRVPRGVNRRAGSTGILVVAPLDAHIGQGGVPDRLKYRHKRLPDWAYKNILRHTRPPCRARTGNLAPH